jgi:hypothetical protein
MDEYQERREEIKAKIRDAFKDGVYPGDEHLRESSEGDEPFLVEKEFKGKSDWTVLEANFIDQAPQNFGSALSFFSREALQFYLPAYLIAELDGKLSKSNPIFALTFGFDDESKNKEVNPKRYGRTTWFEERSKRLSLFTSNQVAAIVNFLQFVRDEPNKLLPFEKDSIDQALRNYWPKVK